MHDKAVAPPDPRMPKATFLPLLSCKTFLDLPVFECPPPSTRITALTPQICRLYGYRNVSEGPRPTGERERKPRSHAAHNGRRRPSERRTDHDLQRRDHFVQRKCSPNGRSRVHLGSSGLAQHREGLVHKRPCERCWGCGIPNFVAQVRSLKYGEQSYFIISEV